MMIGLAGALVSGLAGGAVVALTVRSDDKAREELPPVAKPALINADGRGHLPTNKPTTALLELWSSAQWGDVPRVLRLHDPAVRRSVGNAVIAGTYTHQRTRMSTRKPRVLGVEVRGQTATVRYRVEGEPQTAPPQLAILRRYGATWFMRYDTFVEEAIPFYIATLRGGNVDPQRGDRLASARAASTYREQAVKLAQPPRARPAPPRAQPAPQSAPPAPPSAQGAPPAVPPDG